MSIESELKKFNTTVERLTIAIENLTSVGNAVKTPYTETKVVQPEVKKVSKEPESVENEKPAKEKDSVEPKAQEADDFDDDLDTDFDERPALTHEQAKVFAREKIAERKTTHPDLKAKIKKKISDLGAANISFLEKDSLSKFVKFLNKL